MRKHSLLISFMFFYGTVFPAEISKVGTTAMSFLKIDAGARQVAMGSASVSTTEDALSLY